MEEIPILDVVVGQGEVQMEDNKIKVVKEWKIPTKIKEVESFLELLPIIYQNFSYIAKPLNKLEEKNEWE